MENIGLGNRGNAQISEILAALVSKGSFGNRTPEVKAETNRSEEHTSELQSLV